MVSRVLSTVSNPILKKGEASSKGRGNRAAGWFDDLIQDREGTDSLQSLVLEGGITGWANAGPGYVEWMADYDADFWQKPKGSRQKA